MDRPLNRLLASLAYIPVVGWIYILIFQRHNDFAMFHVRQSIGLFVFLIAAFLAWVFVGWLIAWIPYGMVLNVMLFTIVLVAFGFGVIAWIIGIINTLQGRVAFLPILGRAASRIHI